MRGSVREGGRPRLRLLLRFLLLLLLRLRLPRRSWRPQRSGPSPRSPARPLLRSELPPLIWFRRCPPHSLLRHLLHRPRRHSSPHHPSTVPHHLKTPPNNHHPVCCCCGRDGVVVVGWWCWWDPQSDPAGSAYRDTRPIPHYCSPVLSYGSTRPPPPPAEHATNHHLPCYWYYFQWYCEPPSKSSSSLQ